MKKIIVTTAVIVFSMAIIAYAAPDSNSIVKDDIEYYMQTDKHTYHFGEDVEMLYRVTNLGEEDVTFNFTHIPEWNFWVEKNGETIFRAVNGWRAEISEFTLSFSESKEFPLINPSYLWNMEDYEGNLVNAGEYNVIGGLFDGYYNYNHTKVSVPIEIIPPPAITYYVNATEGSDDNDGLSSQTPFATIQKAIESAFDGDTVEVWPGIYTGDGNRDINFLGKAITVRSTDPNDPNIVAATIIDCNGTETEPHRGFYFHSGEDSNSVLDGFTITGGYGPAEEVWSQLIPVGGAIFCKASSPRISNCIFTNSYAIGYGGGMFNDNSSPTLINCTFSGNTAVWWGGAMCNYSDSSPVLTNCTFSSNSAGYQGGGVCNYSDSNPVLTNCTFGGNYAYWDGGGMYNYINSSPMLTNCTFSGNSARGVGGGMDNMHESNPILTGCTIRGNSAGSKGGGMANTNFSSPVLTNCIISGNSAGSKGGGMGNRASNPTVTNCTFSGNSAHYGGAMHSDSGSSPTLTNCILWGDTPEEIYMISGTPVITYCDVQDGWEGKGNIDSDPCFVDDANDDYHLKPTSPCIDAGDPCYIAEPDETDIDGNPRVIGGRIDMGAYEVTPADLLLELSENLDAMSLPKGIANSLLVKLDAALQKLEDDNENDDAAAINLLEAFIKTVQAQYDKKIPEAYADVLIAAAQEIIELLSDE